MIKKSKLIFSVFSVILFLGVSVAQSVSADQCLPDTSGAECTAGDFFLTETALNPPVSCIAGSLIDIELRIGMDSKASERYDIGFFVGDGGEQPIGGSSCTFSSLTPLEPTFDGTSGSGPYRELDGNACGDASSADGEIFKDIKLTGVLCEDKDGDGHLDVSYAVAWKQSKGQCMDPDSAAEFINSSSKCGKTVSNVDIIVEPVVPPVPSIDVSKIAVPNVIQPGDEVVYTISVLNDGPVTITLNSLNDVPFGDLNGQGSCSTPQTIASGDTYSCSFAKIITGAVPSTHKNTVTASGTDGTTTPVNDNDSAEVAIVDFNEAGIGFLVWLDLNADGFWQKDEPGVDGVTLALKNSLGTVIDTTTTLNNGQYFFKGLSAGDYQVVVTDDASRLNGMVLTAGVEPHDVILSIGQKYMLANFGYAKASISVSKQANPSVIHAPGDTVSYTISVANKGPIVVDLDQLIDSKFGDLNGQGDCSVPQTIAVGAIYSCSFDQTINGSAGDFHENIVLGKANDLDGHHLIGADSEIVYIIDGNNAAIGDFVWFDSNSNGIHDEGEPGINDVTIQLMRDTTGDGVYNVLVGTTSTLNSGEYDFIDLPAGDYQVVVTDTNNQLQGLILTGGTEPHLVTLATAQIYSLADFGYAKEPLPEIAVYKVADPTVIHAPSEDVTYTIAVKNIGQTDVTLNVLIDDRFGDLNGKGDCTVPQSIVISDIYTCSFTETVSGSVGDTHTNTVGAVAKDSNDNVAHGTASADVAIIDSNNGSIGNLVWHDINANGIFDVGEPGIGNVTINLTQSASVIATTTTDSSGAYDFINLAAGTYQVQVTDTNNVLVDAILTSGIEPHDVTLSVGQIYGLADFGYAKAQIIVLKEGDRSSIHAPSEAVTYTFTVGNSGFVDVTLTELNDDKFGNLNGQGTCLLPQSIAARTSYSCSVTKTISGNVGDNHTNIVTANAIDSDGNSLKANDDFNVVIIDSNSGTIGDLVWNDENGNGIRESSEPGLGLVSVELVLNNVIVDTKFTTANGHYLFAGLSAGSYQVNVTDTNGIVTSMTLTGGIEPHPVTLGVGELYQNADFGYYRAPVIPPIEPPIEPPVTPPTPGPAKPIPTMSEWGLNLMAMLLGLIAFTRARRQV